MENYSYKTESKITINQPVHVVYHALHNMADWPKHLPHVEAIDVVYDDGKYQEFWMKVLSENDSVLNVRSIRKCERGNHISFFQPEPPKFLKHHAGGWLLKENEHGGCEVIAHHYWNLDYPSAAEQFPEGDKGSTAQQVEELLKGHSRFALDTWKKVLEEEAH